MDESHGRCRVLLAEDNPVNMELSMAVLSLVDCDVTPVPDGAQALAAYQQQPFDLLLLDFHMPKMDGDAVARAVREIEAAGQLEPVWIVALTGSAMPEEYQRCMGAGMNEVHTKPMAVAQLRDLVAAVCKGKHDAAHCPG